MTLRQQFDEWLSYRLPNVHLGKVTENLVKIEIAWLAFEAGYEAAKQTNRQLAAKVCEPIGEDGDDEEFDHRQGVTDLEKETILTLVRVFDASLRTNNEPEIVEAFMQAAELIDRLQALGLIRRSPITQAEELKAAMERLYGSDSPD